MLPMSHPIPARRARALAVPTLLLVLALGLPAVLGGCGGAKKDDGGVLLATVGATDIRSSYYEDRLGRLEENELPKGDDGQPMDMSTMEGKKAFLTTLINKELMVQKANQLGYADDPRIVQARNSLTSYEAGLAMWRSVVGNPANSLSNEEVDDLYAKMGRQRRISYLICNFKDDAEAARKMALDGADWEDVVKRYHDGAMPADGRMQLVVPWGRFSPDFEGPVYATEVGQISEPFYSQYGWWVVRVEGEKQIEKPAKEEYLAQILDLARNRKMQALREAFRQQIDEKYKVKVEDPALLKAWQGLPDNEPVLDPETNQPVPREQLEPLQVATADLDLPFYSYEINGETKAFTLGDYKIKFDRMNTFQRPKKGSLMGGMRTSIISELERGIMDNEAKERGFYEDPEVVTKVKIKVEEMMVTALYGDVVSYDEHVTPEQMQAYWADHHADFDRPETRSGHLVIAADEDAAAKPREQVMAGTDWRDIVARFGTDANNQRSGGQLTDVSVKTRGPVRETLFALEQGQVSDPFPVGDGRFAVVRLEQIKPGGPAEMTEVSEQVGGKIKQERKEAAFQKLLDDWSQEVGVVRHDENLAQVKSWKELTNVEAPGPEVPRKM